MPAMFNLAKTFFTPLMAGRTIVNTGIRNMSSISVNYIQSFTQKIMRESLTFKEITPSKSGIRYTTSYENTPIIIRVNANFPAAPLYTAFAKFTSEQGKATQKALFTFDDVNQLPENWQIPDRQPQARNNFPTK